MPKGFSKPGMVLKLQRSLYGLRQSLHNYFKYTAEKFASVGLKQSHVNECLFISRRAIVLIWVNNVLIYSPRREWIEETIAERGPS